LVGVDHLAFNLSHSGATAVLAIARGPQLHVGIDVERFDRRVPIQRAARRAFDDAERSLVASDQRGLLTMWVAKEALLKATGDGVSAGLDAVRLERDDAGEWQGRWRVDGAVAPLLVHANHGLVWAAAGYRLDDTGTRHWLTLVTAPVWGDSDT
jgi:phosphopantetheinyl transferase